MYEEGSVGGRSGRGGGLDENKSLVSFLQGTVIFGKFCHKILM